MREMVFNGDANNQDLCTLADSEIGTNDVSFPLQRKALFASQAGSEVWKAIFSALNGWQYQDKNDSSNPYGDVASVAGTRTIAIPTAAETVVGVARLDSATGLYVPLKPITIEQIRDMGETVDSFMSVSGTPEYYMPRGNSIFSFPANSASTANFYRVYFDRKAVTFAPSDTSVSPGFASDFHHGIAIGMAYFEANRATLPQLSRLEVRWFQFLSDVKAFYRKRYKENVSRVRMGPDYSDQMI